MSVKQRVNEIVEVLLKVNFLEQNGSILAWSLNLYKLASEELNK